MTITTSRRTGTDLSTELRERTHAAHREAESSAFLAAIGSGQVTAQGWAALLGRLLPVYAALERVAVGWRDDPFVGPFLLPGLARGRRLADDLEHLTGAAHVPVSAAARAYVDRIEQVAGSSAPAFLAHHYTRYLGDLSGGQVIRVSLERSLGLTASAGVAALSFPGVAPGRAKRTYRRLLDELPFGLAEREELVGEALAAYRLNVDLARELDTAGAGLGWVTP